MNRLVAPPSGPAPTHPDTAPPVATPGHPSKTDGSKTDGSKTYESKFSASKFHESGRFHWSGEPASLVTFGPTHYEPGYAYPLMVWLHGAHQSEHYLPEIMANLSTRNYVAVSPQAVGDAREPWRQTAQGIADTEQRILAAVEVAADRFHVHPERIFLAGPGCGGTAALRVALASPHRFAGAASFDGPAPQGYSPLMRVKSARSLPLMLAFGEGSARYPVDQVCQDLRLFHSAGMQLNVRQEPGDGDLTNSMLAELDRWMMNIVCGAKVVSC